MRDHVPDDIDRRILELVQRDARVSAEALGAAAGVSASTAHRRLQRLRASGVIEAEVALVSPKALGRPVLIAVGLTLQREDDATLQQVRTWLAAEPMVQSAWYVTGEADFLLLVTARDVEDYDAFTRELMTQNPGVRTFTTSIALSTVKRTTAIPTTD